MQKLFTNVKLTLAKVTTTSREAPPDVIFANYSEGIPLVCSSHNKHIRERSKDRRGGNPVSSVLNALNLRFLSQRPNLEVTPFLLRDDDTVVRPPCAGRIWLEKEDGQHDLMRMIEHLTSTSSEDWAMVLDACKRASANEANAREVTEALRRQLEYGNSLQQLSAARLWAVMLLNSSELFVHQCTKSKVLDTLEDVLTSQHTPLFVRENLRIVIDAAARASSGTPNENQSRIRMLWRKVTVMPAAKLDECMSFGADIPVVNPPSPRRTTAVNVTPSHPRLDPQSLPVQAAVPPDMEGTRLQRGPDEDDRALSEQSTERASRARPMLECCICMEELPTDPIMHPDSRGPVATLFDEYEFIILCPACNATKGKGKASGTQSEASQSSARNLGHINKQFCIRTDVVMRPFPTHRSTPTRSLPRPLPVRPTSHPAPEDVENVLHGMRVLRDFDKEARALSDLRSELSTSAKQSFECSICMDKMPADSFARVDTCGHTFCRECLRRHVIARLEEHRFPILCPTCTAANGKGKKKAGEISESLALNLGLTDEQFGIWTEMEMASFSIPIHCRKCQQSMFVARDDHEETNTIVCPLPDCKHAWCKQCQQSIDFSGPKHTCDGTAELDHLMQQQGWKYCPTCKTPIQKDSGCNHMTCRAPSCNTHFCYGCGGLIVRSSLSSVINQALSSHFAGNCTLFQLL